MGNKPGGQAGGGKGVDAAALEQARAIQEQDAAWLSAEKSRLKRMPAMHQNGMYHVPPGKPLIATLPGSNAQVLYESVHDSGRKTGQGNGYYIHTPTSTLRSPENRTTYRYTAGGAVRENPAGLMYAMPVSRNTDDGSSSRRITRPEHVGGQRVYYVKAGGTRGAPFKHKLPEEPFEAVAAIHAAQAGQAAAAIAAAGGSNNPSKAGVAVFRKSRVSKAAPALVVQPTRAPEPQQQQQISWKAKRAQQRARTPNSGGGARSSSVAATSSSSGNGGNKSFRGSGQKSSRSGSSSGGKKTGRGSRTGRKTGRVGVGATGGSSEAGDISGELGKTLALALSEDDKISFAAAFHSACVSVDDSAGSSTSRGGGGGTTSRGGGGATSAAPAMAGSGSTIAPSRVQGLLLNLGFAIAVVHTCVHRLVEVEASLDDTTPVSMAIFLAAAGWCQHEQGRRLQAVSDKLLVAQAVLGANNETKRRSKKAMATAAARSDAAEGHHDADAVADEAAARAALKALTKAIDRDVARIQALEVVTDGADVSTRIKPARLALPPPTLTQADARPFVDPKASEVSGITKEGVWFIAKECSDRDACLAALRGAGCDPDTASVMTDAVFAPTPRLAVDSTDSTAASSPQRAATGGGAEADPMSVSLSRRRLSIEAARFKAEKDEADRVARLAREEQERADVAAAAIAAEAERKITELRHKEAAEAEAQAAQALAERLAAIATQWVAITFERKQGGAVGGGTETLCLTVVDTAAQASEEKDKAEAESFGEEFAGAMRTIQMMPRQPMDPSKPDGPPVSGQQWGIAGDGNPTAHLHSRLAPETVVLDAGNLKQRAGLQVKVMGDYGKHVAARALNLDLEHGGGKILVHAADGRSEPKLWSLEPLGDPSWERTLSNSLKIGDSEDASREDAKAALISKGHDPAHIAALRKEIDTQVARPASPEPLPADSPPAQDGGEKQATKESDGQDSEAVAAKEAHLDAVKAEHIYQLGALDSSDADYESDTAAIVARQEKELADAGANFVFQP